MRHRLLGLPVCLLATACIDGTERDGTVRVVTLARDTLALTPLAPPLATIPEFRDRNRSVTIWPASGSSTLRPG